MADRKKIFDITPSRKKPLVPAEQPHFAPAKTEQKPSAPGKKLLILFAGTVLLAGGVLSYFLIPPKVKVEIWPEQKTVGGTIIAAVSAVQKDGNAMAGEIAEQEKTVSDNFPATGTKLELSKARGIIRVYNNYSTAVQPLVATTRFVSSDGKLFRAPNRVVIPGGTYEGGKLVPGFIDIEAVADQPGPDYNIGPSAFSIPGFAGTPKYTSFYAKSSEPMKGGLKEEVPQVTQQDLDKAREVLTQKAVSEARSAVKNYASSKGYIVLEEAIAGQLAEFKSEVAAGQKAEIFSAQARAVSRALVFKESDLRDFSRNYIQAKLLPEEKLIDRSLKTEYLLDSIDLSKSELSLKLDISARSYAALEEAQIEETVKNKNAEDVEGMLKGFAWVEKARVEFWPFWVNTAPKDLDAIEVVLRLD